MLRTRALSRRAVALLAAGGLLVSSVVPAVLGSSAAASPLTQRSIKIHSSKVGQTGVAYDVSFKVGTATAIKGIVVDLCQNSPLLDTSCINTNGAAVTSSGTLGVTRGADAPVAFTVSASAGLLKLTSATGTAVPSVGDTVSFSFTATNPTGTVTTPGQPGTFYARLVTYDTTAAATAYASGTPGTHLDEGGVALSTASQLTINARVQEQLQFCVGSIDNAAPAPADCGVGFSGTTVDLGVVDSTGAVSPVPTTNGGNDKNGAAMVRTNAANGVVVDYFAEQGTGTNHLGSLRVDGATCNAGDVGTDQCFNSAGVVGAAFTAGTENFGMTVSAVDASAGLTGGNLQRDTAYDGDGTLGNKWAWDEGGSFDTIASSASGVLAENRVVDDEMLLLRFAAVAGVTTPTGSYTVTSTYVATATF